MQALHLTKLVTFDDIEPVAFCDIETERAHEAARQYGGQAFDHYESMLESARPEALFITVPPFAHNGVEEAAALRGIHLFIEKPLALDTSTGKRIAGAIRKSKVIATVGYCYRYLDTVARARQLLKGQAISLVSGWWKGPLPETLWWRQMDKSGGQIVEQCTHVVDLMRYLCGDVAELYAVGSSGCLSQVDQYDVYDSTSLAMRLKNGAAAGLTCTCVADGHPSMGIEVVTPEMTLVIENGALTVRTRSQETTYRPEADMYAEEDRAFLEAVRTGKKNRLRSTLSDALKSLQVSLAANESITSGLPVKP
jgi:predicted dehydrogenase